MDEILFELYGLSDIFLIENDKQQIYIVNESREVFYEALYFDRIPQVHDKNKRLPIIEEIRQI
jgi:hypothetical protein